MTPAAVLEPPAEAVAGWLARFRAPGPLVAGAFAVGIAGTIALHVVASQTTAQTRSVMLDAPPPRVAPLSSQAPAAAKETPRVTVVAAKETPRVTAVAAPTRESAVRVTSGSATSESAPQIAKVTLRASETGVRADPGHALADALARCGDEAFFARPACEERVRARHCADASTLPQCAPPARDYGQ